MTPSVVLPMIASSEDSTIDANRDSVSPARFSSMTCCRRSRLIAARFLSRCRVVRARYAARVSSEATRSQRASSVPEKDDCVMGADVIRLSWARQSMDIATRRQERRALAAGAGGGGASRGHQLALGWVAPFVLFLLSIALLPLIVPHWWESNLNKGAISALFGVPVAIYIAQVDGHRLIETGIEYIAFIVLLAALFIISGGIYLRGSLSGTPSVNTIVLAVGAILSNIIGTTGASMLLIRPMLRANEKRQHQVHIVIFFIFVVSNIGGLLTPLGDPPLFLGFLRGVPFQWTLRLLPPWLLMNAALLVIFYLWDRRQLKGEDVSTREALGRGGAAPH